MQVRDRTEPKLKVLELVCGLLKAAEGNLRISRKSCVLGKDQQKCKTLREPQVWVLCMSKFLKTNEEIM